MNEAILHKEIEKRYEGESQQACDLGCGNTIDILAPKQGERILDLGCGRGEETIKVAMITSPYGYAVGLDLTVAMIEQAKELAISQGVQNVDFMQGDIEALPLRRILFMESQAIVSSIMQRIRKLYTKKFFGC